MSTTVLCSQHSDAHTHIAILNNVQIQYFQLIGRAMGEIPANDIVQNRATEHPRIYWNRHAM